MSSCASGSASCFRRWWPRSVSFRVRAVCGPDREDSMRTLIRLLTATAAVAALQLAPAVPPASAVAVVPKDVATATLANAAGKPIGLVTLVSGGGHDVRVAVTVTGATPGYHGIHIHSVGKCEGPDFPSAGGHP